MTELTCSHGCSTVKTIIFCFAGRQANIELQLLHIQRILRTDPDVEYHVWDCSENESDHRYLQSIKGERISYHDDFYGLPHNDAWNSIYRHYTAKRFRHHQFVKIDEDIVFLEDANFGNLIRAIDRNRDMFISAAIINNGACTQLFPELQQSFTVKRVVPSQVHQSVGYAVASHRYLVEHWRELLDQPPELILATDWLSINMIGYSWDLGREICANIGGLPPWDAYSDVDNVPQEINRSRRLGDEGVINLYPRVILQSMIAAHLYFGPQRKRMRDADILEIRQQYAELGKLYVPWIIEHPTKELLA